MAAPFYLMFCFLSYFLLDFILRRTNISYSLLNLYDKIPLFFVLGWCFLLCGIICILPGMIKKIFMGLTAGIYSILTVIHGAYINVFNKFFSFSDLSLAGEGIEFLDISYIHIRKIIVACVIISLLLMALGIWLVPGREKIAEKNRKRCGKNLMNILQIWNMNITVTKKRGSSRKNI